jgi:hypothetical protein
VLAVVFLKAIVIKIFIGTLEFIHKGNGFIINVHTVKKDKMCNIVVINKGEKEIETPRQFLEHFGFMPEKEFGHNTIEMDYCLCQCDFEQALIDNNIPFKKDCGDVYVGMLDEIVGDDD